MFIIKKKLLLLALLLFVLCATVLIVFGKTYTVKCTQEHLSKAIPPDKSAIRIQIENENPGAEITGYDVVDDNLVICFSALKKGKTSIAVFFGNDPLTYFRLYTHPFGVITYDSAFGDCTGDIVVPISLLIYLISILWFLIKRYRADENKAYTNTVT